VARSLHRPPVQRDGVEVAPASRRFVSSASLVAGAFVVPLVCALMLPPALVLEGDEVADEVRAELFWAGPH